MPNAAESNDENGCSGEGASLDIDVRAEGGEFESDNSSGCQSGINKAKPWLIKWHLPLMLFSAVVFGYFVPSPGASASDVDMGGVCVTSKACVWSSIGQLCVALYSPYQVSS